LDAEVFLVFQHAETNGKSHPTPEDIMLLESDIILGGKGTLTKPHRFQAPIPILETIIRTFSDPNDLVVDPYAGGGTTLAVANSLNRRAIGYEIDASSYEHAQPNLPHDDHSSNDY
jgi:DNA modification methylase